MIRYKIVLHWNEEKQVYVAWVKELAGCAAVGSTYQEAVNNIEAAIRAWVEEAVALGRPIPQPNEQHIYG